MGGKSHLKLNTAKRPIANKYCEGKMKRTLKRELKVPEIVGREAIGFSDVSRVIRRCGVRGVCEPSASRPRACLSVVALHFRAVQSASVSAAGQGAEQGGNGSNVAVL